jgi:hypothetical protein
MLVMGYVKGEDKGVGIWRTVCGREGRILVF